MPSGARFPPDIHSRQSPYHTVDFGSSYTTSQSQNGQASNGKRKSITHAPQQGQHRETFRRYQEDEDNDGDDSSYEVLRTYESNESVLPTYSPSTSISGHTADSSRLYSPVGTPTRSGARDGTTGVYSSMDSSARRFGAGSFDPYAGKTSLGEDKVAEKTRLLETVDDNPKSGFGSGEKRAASARYANLIPEKRPPRSPLDTLRAVCENEIFVTCFYLALSLFTRLWKIGKSDTVIWDEAHFGKFGSHYLKHEFYFDVHPPLGKMLVGLAGLLSGYGGQFEFKSGETYPKDVNYVGMRIMLAMFGVAMVPIAYSTSGGLGWNWRARHFLTLMVLFDNAWLVISRFILLDSMLLFFTFTTVHGLVMFHQYQRESFSEMWWFWLSFTGVSIGCVASVKWVGLFATALVGYYTIEDLWDKFGDLRMPVRTYARHWCARILCLIVVPLSVYMTCFKIHFMILSRSGPGDAQMSSLFQAHLRGNNFAQAPLEAAFGSQVTFKNMGYGGGLLHSHVQTYPVGSQQQQVTCYHYKDDNNDFIITPPWEDDPVPDANSTMPLRMVKSGDVIRLVHHATGRNLHSHAIAAPVTKENYEISGYGNATVGDSNDYWIVEVVDDMITGSKGKKGDSVKSLTTRMRFKHQELGCYMRAANAILPQWGWKQVEVSCDKENNPKDDHTYWNIESHINERLPSGNTKLYKSPFLRDFVHLNVAMMTSNNALIPDADKEDILASKPLDWPWLYNGLRMNSWADDSTKYYLIGNPVIWWSSSLSLMVGGIVLLWYLGRMQRKIVDLSPKDWEQFTFGAKISGLGWFLHYLPFLLMARVCYIHHYLPTLYFAALMLTHLLDHFLWNASTARYANRMVRGQRTALSETTKNITFAIVCGAVLSVFWFFRETAWGIEGPIWKKKAFKWRHSWNIQD
ncbi:hypothetical protein CBS101457_006779 [Exobasidium rhododendri]|nr:hypothetical protein CBS101457_006779 [Exobasidium rhododendri]